MNFQKGEALDVLMLVPLVHGLRAYCSRICGAVLWVTFILTISTASKLGSGIHGIFAIYGIFAAGLMFLISLAALQGTLAALYYHRLMKTRVLWKNVAVKTALAIGYLTLVAVPAVFVSLVLKELKFSEAIIEQLLNFSLLLSVWLTFLGLLPFSKDRPITTPQAQT